MYGIQPDGSGVRRITNAPDTSALSGFSKGTVTVDVTNQDSSVSLFFVYISGAPQSQSAVIAKGSTVRVTLPNVADFGAVNQSIIVTSGDRWFYYAASYADVKAGQTVAASPYIIHDQQSSTMFGADNPAWRFDGAQLDYIFAGCAAMHQISAQPAPGAGHETLPSASSSPFACLIARGPTVALGDQILYTTPSYSDQSIYRVTEGSTDAGTKLIARDADGELLDLHWLPDGSGFLFHKLLRIKAAPISMSTRLPLRR